MLSREEIMEITASVGERLREKEGDFAVLIAATTICIRYLSLERKEKQHMNWEIRGEGQTQLPPRSSSHFLLCIRLSITCSYGYLYGVLVIQTQLPFTSFTSNLDIVSRNIKQRE
jgi:hypothetical protein